MREAGLLLEGKVSKELPSYRDIELGVFEFISAVSLRYATPLNIIFTMLGTFRKTQAWKIQISH